MIKIVPSISIGWELIWIFKAKTTYVVELCLGQFHHLVPMGTWSPIPMHFSPIHICVLFSIPTTAAAPIQMFITFHEHMEGDEHSPMFLLLQGPSYLPQRLGDRHTCSHASEQTSVGEGFCYLAGTWTLTLELLVHCKMWQWLPSKRVVVRIKGENLCQASTRHWAHSINDYPPSPFLFLNLKIWFKNTKITWSDYTSCSIQPNPLKRAQKTLSTWIGHRFQPRQFFIPSPAPRSPFWNLPNSLPHAEQTCLCCSSHSELGFLSLLVAHILMKIAIRVIYESLSPVMLRTPKNFFDVIFPALGSTCHILDAQQICVVSTHACMFIYIYTWTDGWISQHPAYCIFRYLPPSHRSC